MYRAAGSGLSSAPVIRGQSGVGHGASCGATVDIVSPGCGIATVAAVAEPRSLPPTALAAHNGLRGLLRLLAAFVVILCLKVTGQTDAF